MKAGYKMFVAACATLAMAVFIVPGVQAQYGLSAKMIKPVGWHLQALGRAPDACYPQLSTKASNHEPSIVGMWHVIFTAETMNNGTYVLPDRDRQCRGCMAPRRDRDYEFGTSSAGWQLLFGRLGAHGEIHILSQPHSVGRK